MAFQEIADHTKKVIDIAADKEHDKWHKIKEIGLEIAIIVFAVSLSIWLHSIGEHRHEQQQVRSFLLGLKRDLRADINQLYIILNEDQKREEQLRYLGTLKHEGKLVEEKELEKFETAFTNIGKKTTFNPIISRYDGFKSSGKLTNIENNVLLERVTSLYQSTLAEMKSAEQAWLQRQNQLQDYIENDFNGDSDIKHHYQLITARKGKRLLEHVAQREQMLERYRNYIDLGTMIIKDVDIAYPNNEKSSFFTEKK